jgi:hypothetical protein
MPSGRTSMPGLQATDLLATLPACSGRRHNQLCRLSHECKLGDQTKDDADKEPREERSCGRSQTSLYNETRTHLALDKDAPVSRPVQRTGVVRSLAILGGLHHNYACVFGTHSHRLQQHRPLLGLEPVDNVAARQGMARIRSARAHTRPGRSFRLHSENTRCATGVRRRGHPRFPVSEISRHSRAESACAIRCTGRTPRGRGRAALRRLASSL